MPSEQPLVSILLCTYDAGAYLADALASVIEQTYANLEIIVVDDGSTDGSVDAAQARFDDARIRWIRQPNAGKPAALNVALDQMKGDFYAVQDADDLSHPRRIERLLATMLERPHLAGVYSGHELIFDSQSLAPTFHGIDENGCKRAIAQYRMPAHDPTAMYRTSMVGDLRYDPSLLIGEGFDYILRVGERWPLMVIGECLYSYRIHWASVTKRDPGLRARLVREVLERACARRGDDFGSKFAHVGASNGSSNEDRDNGIAAHFMESVCDLKRSGRRREALAVALQCARLHPVDPHYYKALVYAATPARLVTGSRKV
ncbi:MAG TPA: glycosyltransferase family A protein [Tepidisphaeraceae bacterium]|nr:glycosyltransferase family A protein [Tepidisphaeraceae bacterium]